ncbi:MAG: T9SS type A sorting domain-containing protein, partial [Bacteroidales bacterium]|nr:T9SS type A sorting domain-containing protein [Bacteroidales bacterium]
MLTSVIENWSNGDWTFFYKESYIYNNSNQPTQITGQLWNGSTWTFSEKYTYTYNTLGFVTMAVGELWENSQWKFFERGQFGHNNFGGIQSSLHELWVSNSWMNVNLNNYTYDANGNALICDLYHWDGNSWIQNQDGVMRLFYSNSINSMDIFGYKAFASYTSIQVGIPDSERENKQTLSLSPNPANDKVILHFELANDAETEICIYNNGGVKVLEVLKGKMNKGENQVVFSVIDLTSGIYFIHLTTGNKTSQAKLMITK